MARVDLSNTGINALAALTGPARNLTYLDLSNTSSLAGPIPPSWGVFLPSLQCLALHANALCGQVPSGLPCFFVETNKTKLGGWCTLQAPCAAVSLGSWGNTGSQDTCRRSSPASLTCACLLRKPLPTCRVQLLQPGPSATPDTRRRRRVPRGCPAHVQGLPLFCDGRGLERRHPRLQGAAGRPRGHHRQRRQRKRPLVLPGALRPGRAHDAWRRMRLDGQSRRKAARLRRVCVQQVPVVKPRLVARAAVCAAHSPEDAGPVQHGHAR